MPTMTKTRQPYLSKGIATAQARVNGKDSAPIVDIAKYDFHPTSKRNYDAWKRVTESRSSGMVGPIYSTWLPKAKQREDGRVADSMSVQMDADGKYFVMRKYWHEGAWHYFVGHATFTGWQKLVNEVISLLGAMNIPA
jgi:hypothetical protein